MITKLNHNEIFVFGSNKAGRHGGGAALQAKEQFGALDGVGEGLTGRCYAFPTLDENFKQLSKEELTVVAKRFLSFAESRLDLLFLMTAVGTGIAGHDPEFMKSLFKKHPVNVILPTEWVNIKP